jgi:hypothetical protein
MLLLLVPAKSLFIANVIPFLSNSIMCDRSLLTILLRSLKLGMPSAFYSAVLLRRNCCQLSHSSRLQLAATVIYTLKCLAAHYSTPIRLPAQQVRGCVLPHLPSSLLDQTRCVFCLRRAAATLCGEGKEEESQARHYSKTNQLSNRKTSYFS